MKLNELDALIRAVCPIDGINSNGYISFKDEATEQQRLNAQVVMDQNIGLLSNEQDVRAEILSVSQQALASGFLHVIMLDMMGRYLAEAQKVVPVVTEADLINPESPYYSHAYVETKLYYDKLKALQDQK